MRGGPNDGFNSYCNPLRIQTLRPMKLTDLHIQTPTYYGPVFGRPESMFLHAKDEKGNKVSLNINEAFRAKRNAEEDFLNQVQPKPKKKSP